ncbi:MAG: DUF3078 domain-containing protein [Alphaproteobacteria bacterium]|nr:DUF3078 domain-containing protein [Alphaproteobacteria bacterium]
MTNRLSLLLLPALVLVAAARNAQAADYQQYGWVAELKKAGVELSSTKIKNSEEYRSSPNAELSGNSESLVKGIFDFSLINQQAAYKWDNNIFMEYGKTKVHQNDGPAIENETADKILLSTDYAMKVWRYWDADVGPFIQGAYQTEFDPNDDAPRTKIIRGMAGMKMFDGPIIKNLYAGLVGEYDFTYKHDKTRKWAYEIGVDATYPLREGINFNLTSYFRDYFEYSKYNPRDFDYEWNNKADMMVDIYNGLQMGPYIQYFRAKDRGSNKYGSSTIIGVQGSYGGSWGL